MCKRLICLTSFVAVLALAGNASAQLDPASISNGNVYLFEDVGLNVPDDSANNHISNLIGNPKVVDSPNGKALQFNGISDGVHIPDAATVNTSTHQNRTLIAIFNCNDVSKSQKQVVYEDGGATRGLNVYVFEGRVYVGGWNLSDYTPEWTGTFLSAPIRSGKWYAVAAVLRDGRDARENDKFEMWLDGVLIDTGPGAQLNSRSNDNGIGYHNSETKFHDGNTTTTGDYFGGMIDEIWIINSALSANELGGFVGKVWPYVSGPEPADDSIVEATWANLAWKPGELAVSHDVYFGTSFDDVNSGAEGTFAGNTTLDFQIVGFFGYPAPGGLQPGTTYYWRIDEVNDSEPSSPWKGQVWSFIVPPLTAYALVPADGAKFLSPDVALSWRPGYQAKLHHLYFGDNAADVEAGAPGTYKGPVASLTYAPGTLQFEKLYYWRIDEFDGAATHQGEVSSFQIKPDIPITDPNLLCWWTLDEGQGSVVLDWSGHGNDGTMTGNPRWIDGLDRGGLNFNGAYDDVTVNFSATSWPAWTMTVWCKSDVLGQGNNSAIFSTYQGTGGGFQLSYDGADNYRYHADTDFNIGPAATSWAHIAISYDGALASAYYNGEFVGTFTPGADDLNHSKFALGANRAVDNWFDGSIDDFRVYTKVLTQEEIQLVMRVDLKLAWGPSPADRSQAPTNVAKTLNWSAGDGVSQYDVYLGDDEDAVKVADASDTTGIYRNRQSATSYAPPEGVDPNSGPFYWRIDSVLNDGTIDKGRVWSYSVVDYALVDDFESYNDIESGQPGSNLIYETWVDGYGVPTNGSTMGYAVPFAPTMETDTVHGGRQSAPMEYNNVGAAFSEVTRTFAAAQDWTANGAQTLSLRFVGATTNVPGQLYAKVNGVQVNYGGAASNLTLAGWQSWNIDLASIGTNLTNVTSLAIGVQGAGATGLLLLDDIRLYPYPSEVITPVQPAAADLVLHYAFEGNANDSTGASPGSAAGGAVYLPGKIGQAINLDGLDDYVAIDNLSYAGQGLTAVSVCAWIRTSLEDNQIIVAFDRNEYYRLEINGDGAGPGQVGWDVMTDTGQVDYGSSARVDDDQWHHVAGVFDNGKLTIYIDGNPQTPVFGGSTFGTGNTRFGYIGLGSESTAFNTDPKTPANYFAGSVDDVRIYHRALTDGEVAGLAGRTTAFDKPF